MLVNVCRSWPAPSMPRACSWDVEPLDDDTIILQTFNCPYHELAQEHREVCDMDQQMIRQVLGSEVNLSACMMDGHGSCSFVVNVNRARQAGERQAQ
ncbi:MAG: hypothetical protein R2851_06250 [Caldilineaceae bacterium]